MQIDGPLLDRLVRRSGALRWALAPDIFRKALEASVAKAFGGEPPGRRELERYLEGLHLEDLALACACAAGHEPAWDHFIARQRPVLYRAADALDRTGAARETADSLYAELFGLRGEGRSLFRYYHGRSSLSTWLRAVLAQRCVDRLREERRTSPLDDESVASMSSAAPDPERLQLVMLVGRALRDAIQQLEPRDRLRLRAYYEQDLTLAQVGRLTGEHEATVSRRIAQTRKTLRNRIELALLGDAGLGAAEIARCAAAVAEDAGPIDFRELFGSADERKIRAVDRSE